jgi:hypothetical protein
LLLRHPHPSGAEELLVPHVAAAGYGSDTPAEMASKFDTPYKALLDVGVVFHAALGNHANPNQRFYKLFNMGGERYYTFRASEGGSQS